MHWSYPAGTRPSPPVLSDLAKLFGRDIRFRTDRLVTSAGDVATVEGEENLREALFRRFLATPGEFAQRPEYGGGMRDAVYRPFTRALQDGLRNRLEEQALQDPRVSKVHSVTVERVTLGTQEVTRVHVHLEAGGRALSLAPLDFSEEVVRGRV